MTFPRQHRRNGFTLVETLVVVALTAVVMITLASLIVYFYRTNAYLLEQSQAVNSARESINHTVEDLREASYGADGSYPIASAATSSATFYARIGSGTVVGKVRYFLSDNFLYRGVTAPAGAPPSYAGQPEETTLVIDNIRNDATTPVFTYYDSEGEQLSEPINIAHISSIRVTILTDVNPDRAPNVYALTGAATLRNLYLPNL